MHVTQGTFSFLPALSDDEIGAQVQYALDNGWSLSIEHTDDPHPRNVYWSMWGMPLFDRRSPADVLDEMNACRRANPDRYIRVSAYDRRKGRQTTAFSFIVNRPALEPGFRLDRIEWGDRQIRYSLHPHSTERRVGRADNGK